MKSAKGFSLIELLIASSVGLIAIGVVGSVFLSGYQAANKRSLELLLEQDVNDAFRLIKEDILRAGYVSSGASSLKLSGASNIVYVSAAKSCIAYGYDSVDGRIFNEVMHDGVKLLYKSRPLSYLSVSNACKSSGTNSLVYQKQIKVLEFDIQHKVISSATTNSQLLTIKLAANIKSSAVSTTKSIQIKTRNWQ
ncbi:prepilin-type N-terminal cleavage/methylation domain-containing protein [Photobacterium damselae subsp. damselae]|uniref:PilW family protein n=1 Tax=Photobacterium damselae TaxID=38293 RepID=UPI00083A40FF|nr:prepilin-type N-terminal cleavage/methylation domain-containing protein [Photobacterium damselae]QSH56830.1 prepilin-type N-terminal cleavage/methylation domain-containing protein [Photobacterium damselae subsp. damselae]